MSVEIVAELSCNHNGDRDRLGRLIDAAQAAGADAVKFQCYSPDELVALRGDGPAPEPWGSQGWTMRSLYEKARTPFEWFPKIKAHCERLGIPWFSSVFGLEGLALLESLGCERYKIAALDRTAEPLCEAVRATGKPVIVSSPTPRPTSVRSDEPMDWRWFRNVLYCPPGYPQTRFNLARLHEPYNEFTGFSYHGTDPHVCVVAVARGVRMVEAHFMLDAEPSELEANVSLGEAAFATMVRSVRATERLLA